MNSHWHSPPKNPPSKKSSASEFLNPPPGAERARHRPESVAFSRAGKNGFPENGFNLYCGDSILPRSNLFRPTPMITRPLALHSTVRRNVDSRARRRRRRPLSLQELYTFRIPQTERARSSDAPRSRIRALSAHFSFAFRRIRGGVNAWSGRTRVGFVYNRSNGKVR